MSERLARLLDFSLVTDAPQLTVELIGLFSFRMRHGNFAPLVCVTGQKVITEFLQVLQEAIVSLDAQFKSEPQVVAIAVDTQASKVRRVIDRKITDLVIDDSKTPTLMQLDRAITIDESSVSVVATGTSAVLLELKLITDVVEERIENFNAGLELFPGFVWLHLVRPTEFWVTRCRNG